ncbi:hypothetical protein H1R20_g10656, partial [Candolleomyces eurysporus]
MTKILPVSALLSSPDYLVVLPSSVTRTFARIRETNVKKCVILPLTFVEPTDYDKVSPNDKVDIVGLDTFAPGKSLTLVAKHEGSTKDSIPLAHTLNEIWIEWFKPKPLLYLSATSVVAAPWNDSFQPAVGSFGIAFSHSLSGTLIFLCSVYDS